MPKIARMTGARVRLAAGTTFLVSSDEVSEIMAALQASPEIILGCILISGTLDTRKVLRTHIILSAAGSVSAKEQAAYDAFLRVFRNPQGEEYRQVMDLADAIAFGESDGLIWPISV